MAKDWRKTLLKPDATIKDAIKKLDDGELQIVLVVDENCFFKGIVTDGDIRRSILKGVSFDAKVSYIMNVDSSTVYENVSDFEILKLMEEKSINQIPIINKKKEVVGLRVLFDFINKKSRENWIVIMAGGLGSRLGELTKECPKALLEVGGKPILETIVESCRELGFSNFIFSVNFMSNMIEDYFGNGNRHGVHIKYIREDQKMGTAGSLSLIDFKIVDHIIVMNCDLLTKVNLLQLLDFHKSNGAKATMCIKEYDFQVPYGVVVTDAQKITHIDEKPIHKFFVNAGVYVIEPDALELIPRNSYYDMHELYKDLLSGNNEVCAFPGREYWMDIGKSSDFEKANKEYRGIF